MGHQRLQQRGHPGKVRDAVLDENSRQLRWLSHHPLQKGRGGLLVEAPHPEKALMRENKAFEREQTTFDQTAMPTKKIFQGRFYRRCLVFGQARMV